MANIAQIVNVLQSVILTKGHEMVKTPTYYIFQMYNMHQNATLIPSELVTEMYAYNGDSIPALSASASEKDGTVQITLTNADPHANRLLSCDLGKRFNIIDAKIVSAEGITD